MALFPAPRSNARASGPLGLRNDVKRSGTHSFAGSFDRFVNLASPAHPAGTPRITYAGVWTLETRRDDP
ncbi:MAG: hypothetical protein NVSMB18_04760 [Acetobacteraceae bacterium]